MKTTSVLHIEELCCVAEEQLIRKKLAGVEQVGELEFNIPARTLKVEHGLTDTSPIIAAIESLGMSAQPEPSGQMMQPVAAEKSWWTTPEAFIICFSGLCALGGEVLDWVGVAEDSIWIRALASVAIITGAYKTAGRAWQAIKSLTLTIHVLMIVAVIGAVALGDWHEAGMVMFLFAVAEVIEARSMLHARNTIRSLVTLTPETATVKHHDHWHPTRVENIVAGNMIRIKPGERLAVDGVVEFGNSEVDQSPVTGESVPVFRQPGDAVFAGSINCTGTFDYRATSIAADSTIERVMRTVQQATANRTGAERFIDRFARYYTPTILIIALVMAVVPPLVLPDHAWEVWAYRSLVMLVIGCPCALVISTPVAVVSGLANAAKHGILIKGGSLIELGSKLKAIAFDKTGTLTEGRPEITDVFPYGSSTEEEILHLAAAVERSSEHPVATAIVAAHRRMHGMHDDAVLSGFTALTGQGAMGIVDGTKIIVGNHRLAHEIGVCSPELEARLEALESQGKTAIVVMTERKVLGVIALSDTLRASSSQVVNELRQLGVRTMMVTGDNATVAQGIANKAGITDVYADLLPEGKIDIVKQAHERYGTVGMIGDGINDAPALASADVGFAMSASGTGVTIEAAQVALIGDDLTKLPAFIRLSRRTVSVLKQNVLLALGIKFIFALLAVFGYSALWMAIFADMGAALIVVFNGLRLLRGRSA